MWGLIIEKDDIQESYQWFSKWDFSVALAANKLTQAMNKDIQIIPVNEKAVA